MRATGVHGNVGIKLTVSISGKCRKQESGTTKEPMSRLVRRSTDCLICIAPKITIQIMLNHVLHISYTSYNLSFAEATRLEFNLTFDRWTSPSSSSPPTPRIFRLFKRLIKSVWLCFFIRGGWGLEAMIHTSRQKTEDNLEKKKIESDILSLLSQNRIGKP